MGIRIENVKKYYQVGEVQTKALDGVSLEINDGEMVVLLGPSGSGKSTMLNVCSGLDDVTEGTITVDDQVITGLSEKQLTLFRREKLGFIFQQYNLLPNLSLEENIEVGSHLSKDPLSIDEMIETVGLSDHKGKFPQQLSGGQQQRISIARALVKNPSILFCDEPTGALDEKTGKQVLQILQDLNKEYNKTIVIITHNPGIAVMADKVVRMNSGKIIDIQLNDVKKPASEVEW